MRTARHGVALMLVLWVVVALGAIGSVVVRDARSATAQAAAVRASVVARYAAESGIEALVAGLEDTLAALPLGMERREWLNGLERATARGDTVVLGDGRFATAVLDVNARLDVNAASLQSLTVYFSHFAAPASAAAMAQAIRAYIDGAGDGVAPGMPDESFRLARPLRDLAELRRSGLVPAAVLDQAAAGLTVDGDGTINRRAASPMVLASAAGELRDEPSRLLLVARGWMRNHPLTHEVQAVYEIQLDRLVLVHWRERTL
jgi:hypothetical protein